MALCSVRYWRASIVIDRKSIGLTVGDRQWKKLCFHLHHTGNQVQTNLSIRCQKILYPVGMYDVTGCPSLTASTVGPAVAEQHWKNLVFHYYYIGELCQQLSRPLTGIGKTFRSGCMASRGVSLWRASSWELFISVSLSCYTLFIAVWCSSAAVTDCDNYTGTQNIHSFEYFWLQTHFSYNYVISRYWEVHSYLLVNKSNCGRSNCGPVCFSLY